MGGCCSDGGMAEPPFQLVQSYEGNTLFLGVLLSACAAPWFHGNASLAGAPPPPGRGRSSARSAYGAAAWSDLAGIPKAEPPGAGGSAGGILRSGVTQGPGNGCGAL